MRAVAIAAGRDGFLKLGGRLARFRQFSQPGSTRRVIVRDRRGGKTPDADVEQKSGKRSEIVRQQIAVGLVELQYAGPHGEILVPAAELYPGSG